MGPAQRPGHAPSPQVCREVLEVLEARQPLSPVLGDELGNFAIALLAAPPVGDLLLDRDELAPNLLLGVVHLLHRTLLSLTFLTLHRTIAAKGTCPLNF